MAHARKPGVASDDEFERFLSANQGKTVVVLDARDAVQSLGQLEVVASTTAGIFAYAPSGTLVNLEPLSGSTSTYPLTVVEVGSDDRLEAETSVVSSTGCSSSEPQSVPAALHCDCGSPGTREGRSW